MKSKIKTNNQCTKRIYWYKFYIEECPLCGRGHSYKERVYDIPKPTDINDRYHYSQPYDWCIG